LSFFAQSVLALAPAFLIGYVIMIAVWPWSALTPLNPIRGLIDFGEFNTQIRTLFDGQIYTMGNVPRWYVPGYLLIKLPLLMLAGAGVALGFSLWPRGSVPERQLESALLVFTAIFPVLCEVIDRGPVDPGLRHFLFVVPVFAGLASIGFDALLSALALRRHIFAAGAAATFVAALAWNAGTLVMLHPYQYLFFNPLVGGLEGASRRYVTDYWVNIMPEAVDDLEAYIATSASRAAATPWRCAASGCPSRRKPARACDGLRTGTRPTFSSRRRT
jgi:hypothetical protein